MWNFLSRLLAPGAAKAAPPPARSSGMLTVSGVDAYRRQREPTPRELLAELKATAWTCATLNAGVCASHQPRLYVRTSPTQKAPRVPTRPVSRRTRDLFIERKTLTPDTDVAEVTDHPLLDLFAQVNPLMNCFDLWELTTLYQEVTGTAYWFLDLDETLQIPANIWILPSSEVTPRREDTSTTPPGDARSRTQFVDYYEYRSGGSLLRIPPELIIPFSYPDPREPYTRGLSPLRACFEQVQQAAEYSSFKVSKFRNHALPDAIISPDEVIGEEEQERLEQQWNQKMRRGGAGRVIVGESKLHVNLLNHSMGDMAALADAKATKEDIANAFGVPISYLTSSTNLANLQAARTQHAEIAIRPRVRRRDEKLNERLLPYYDPTGRLYLWTDDPVSEDKSFALQRRNSAVQLGYMTIDEARAEIGLPPIEPSLRGPG